MAHSQAKQTASSTGGRWCGEGAVRGGLHGGVVPVCPKKLLGVCKPSDCKVCHGHLECALFEDIWRPAAVPPATSTERQPQPLPVTETAMCCYMCPGSQLPHQPVYVQQQTCQGTNGSDWSKAKEMLWSRPATARVLGLLLQLPIM